MMDIEIGNLVEVIARQAGENPGKPTVIWENRSLNRQELYDGICRIAGGLQALGIHPGDRVAVMLPNVPPYIMIKYAIHLVGAILVPVHVLTRGAELGYLLADCEAKALIAWSGYDEVLHEALEQTESLQIKIQMANDVHEGWIRFRDWFRESEPYRGEPVGGGDDIAMIRYTAGITGHPKGAMISHANVLFSAESTQEVLKILSRDQVLGAIPFYHPFGCTLQQQVIFLSGATLHLQSRFDPQDAMERIGKGEITLFLGLPAHLAGLIDAAQGEYVNSRLRFAISGGGTLESEICRAFESIFHTRIVNIYGTCETSPTIAINPCHRLDTPLDAWGRPVSGMDVRIVDSMGDDVHLGEEGEIVVKGKGVFHGYWNRPGATAMTFDENNWFHTEDLGKLDLDGNIHGIGRMYDRINKGGFSVYPREIENVLNAHPAIRRSAVIGVTHPTLGEEIVACVEFKGEKIEEQKIIDYCTEKLARFKVPKRIVPFEEIPRSPNGVVLRRALRELINKSNKGDSYHP